MKSVAFGADREEVDIVHNQGYSHPLEEVRRPIDTRLEIFAVQVRNGHRQALDGVHSIGSGSGDEGLQRAVWGGNVSPPGIGG